MRSSKVYLAAFLMAWPAVAIAQVEVGVDVEAGDDSYDTTAPGEPVESNDVFYDQLEPYGTWVDEPDVGRVFIPDTDNYVPYRTGHWQNTRLGFVWVSNDRHGWATSHYGRWAYSDNYHRWYWLPDTQWGPAWVEWRQTGRDFGWAPLAPEVVVRRGWQPPVESWHYCGAQHVLDVHVSRYYEPRERVIVIHREARPIEHYARVSNVRVVVGPPRSVLVEHHITVRPVRVEARTIGRWSPAEARAQTARAEEHRATFEVQNQRRIDGNVKIREAHTRVIEAHPQIKAQVTQRLQGSGRIEGGHAAQPARPVEQAPVRPNAPNRAPNRPAEHAPAHANEASHVEPKRVEHAPGRPGEPNQPSRVSPNRPVEHAPARPAEPNRVEHAPARAAAPPHPVAQPEPARSHPQPAQRPAPAHGQPPAAGHEERKGHDDNRDHREADKHP